MAEPKIQSPFDIELDDKKKKLMATEVNFRGLVNSYAHMPAKDRARHINNIQMNLRAFGRWMEGIKISQIHNAGSKFAFENFKQSYFALISRWRKFERNL